MNDNSRKALFLDRDGIINVDHGYVSKIEDFEFSDGIFELLHLFLDNGYLLFIITNQSGIGRGYYSGDSYEKLTSWMLARLSEQNIAISGVYHCPHTPEELCRCRKPDTGMIDQALAWFPIDLKHSWMIGDKPSDIELAHNALIGNTIYIGDTCFMDATLCFASVKECAEYLQANQGKIVSNK